MTKWNLRYSPRNILYLCRSFPCRSCLSDIDDRSLIVGRCTRYLKQWSGRIRVLSQRDPTSRGKQQKKLKKVPGERHDGLCRSMLKVETAWVWDSSQWEMEEKLSFAKHKGLQPYHRTMPPLLPCAGIRMCLKPLFGMESLDLPATSNVAVKKREAPSCRLSGMLKCPDNHEHNLTKPRTLKTSYNRKEWFAFPGRWMDDFVPLNLSSKILAWTTS